MQKKSAFGQHYLNQIIWMSIIGQCNICDSDCMSLSLFKFVQWALKDASFLQKRCIFAVQGHSRSPKVDDFGTNRKRIYNVLLVINSNFGPILHRFRDTSTASYWLKIAYFSYPPLIRHPRSLGSPWNFSLKFTMRKLESWAILQ